MSTNNEELSKLRMQVDTIDAHIQQYLHARAELILLIGNIKRYESAQPNYYRPEREAEILQQVRARNKSLFNNKTLENIFKLILAESVALQKNISVAFLGPQGTYSHAAAQQYFGTNAPAIPVANMQAVLDTVIAGAVFYGVLPIENSITGIIKTAADLVTNSAIVICGEIVLPIQHNLLQAKTEQKITVRRIYAHEQTFLQCQKWLEKNFPNTEKIPLASNALAAQQAAGDVESAAIASEQAAAIYGLQKIAEHLADDPHNQTRFVVIRRH
jgi:chorismate mutase / prephenate dehydratase